MRLKLAVAITKLASMSPSRLRCADAMSLE
jgi:hypothetical protein